MKGNLRKKKAHTSVSSFVDKLARMLDNPEHQDIICWTEDGDAFAIKSVTKLTEEVLPAYFKHQNFSSFIRQLNMYNFNKVRRSEGDHVYMNEHFKRDIRNQFKNIKRRTVEEKDDFMLYEVANPTMLAREINEMAKKQKELESVIKHLMTDNQNLRAENQKLWKRIEKNVEKSDKKLEKLMVFMLFGNQSGNPGSLDPAMIKQQNLELRQQIEMDPQQQTPRQALASNLFSMLQKNKSSEDIRNLLKVCSDHSKSTKSMSDSRYIKRQIKEENEDDPSLYLKHHGEQVEEVKSFGAVDDVNMFIDLEVPPSDNESQLI